MKSNRLEKIIKISIAIAMASVIAFMVLGIVSFFYFTQGLPSIETLKNYGPHTITKFFSEDGEIIGEFSVEKREIVSLDRIPHHLVLAFIAGEDARFFHHKGLDYIALKRPIS
jgi:penicillin-binding protein 1A